jgi:hypothetical protein
VLARYDGPFARVTADDGTVFPRGVPVRARAAALPAARFTFLPPDAHLVPE